MDLNNRKITNHPPSPDQNDCKKLTPEKVLPQTRVHGNCIHEQDKETEENYCRLRRENIEWPHRQFGGLVFSRY